MPTGKFSGLRSARGSYSASGDQTALLTAGASETLLVYDLIITAANAVTVVVKMGSTSKIDFRFAAAGTYICNLTVPLVGAKGEDLVINLSGAVAVVVGATGRIL